MIGKIFFADCRNLFKSVFAVIIAIGVCVIPALYAWLNIFSNHDPYANTGKIKMAVVSLDEGYENLQVYLDYCKDKKIDYPKPID